MNVVADEIFAIFNGAAAAIRCGRAIRDAVGNVGIEVRIGIHAGEVEYDDRAVSGVTVNTGARIMAAAEPGEILVSSIVKDLMAGSDILFRDRGAHIFKGLPNEWRLFTPDVPKPISARGTIPE